MNLFFLAGLTVPQGITSMFSKVQNSNLGVALSSDLVLAVPFTKLSQMPGVRSRIRPWVTDFGDHPMFLVAYFIDCEL